MDLQTLDGFVFDILEIPRTLGMKPWSNENFFYVTGPLRGEFTGHRLIPLTKDSDAEL